MPAAKRAGSPQKDSPKKAKKDNGKKASPAKKEKASPAKKEKREYAMNVNHCLDKKVEIASLTEVLKMPVGLMEGVGPKTEEHLNELGIKTVKDMGTYKFYKIAKAICLLAETEEEGFRHDKARMNIDNALDKKFETKTLTEVMKSSPSVLQGIGPKAETALSNLHLSTVKKLAEYKFFGRAEALVELAAFEKH
eukprot:TRINITY_DN2627_c0_g1_i1.p1 TRINITY_DN2627_c0_g1~~TRINITY_DN2627_c0_g1_i1.p1  ORF type:complete len:194 (+),score=95.85 TRINITY_DN2627_c0_g1_i1:49-630(+)